MKVGTIVLLKMSMLGNPKNTVGLCYETYGNSGASFIFENGDCDGFSKEEQDSFLHTVGHSEHLESFQFRSVMILSDCYRAGKFSSVLDPSDEDRNELIQKMRDDKIDSIV